MKFLYLIITIPATLLRLFLKDHLFYNAPLQLKCLQKRKEIYTVMRIKIHFTTFVKWVTRRSRNKC